MLKYIKIGLLVIISLIICIALLRGLQWYYYLWSIGDYKKILIERTSIPLHIAEILANILAFIHLIILGRLFWQISYTKFLQGVFALVVWNIILSLLTLFFPNLNNRCMAINPSTQQPEPCDCDGEYHRVWQTPIIDSRRVLKEVMIPNPEKFPFFSNNNNPLYAFAIDENGNYSFWDSEGVTNQGFYARKYTKEDIINYKKVWKEKELIRINDSIDQVILINNKRLFDSVRVVEEKKIREKKIQDSLDRLKEHSIFEEKEKMRQDETKKINEYEVGKQFEGSFTDDFMGVVFQVNKYYPKNCSFKANLKLPNQDTQILELSIDNDDGKRFRFRNKGHCFLFIVADIFCKQGGWFNDEYIRVKCIIQKTDCNGKTK